MIGAQLVELPPLNKVLIYLLTDRECHSCSNIHFPLKNAVLIEDLLPFFSSMLSVLRTYHM